VRTPSCFSRYAHARPEIPAPITTTLCGLSTKHELIKIFGREVARGLARGERLSVRYSRGSPLDSLVQFVRSYAARGNEIAVRQRTGYRMASWTYAQIAAAANRVARELEARGVVKGDAVLLWGENSAEWIAAFFGCLLRGAVIVPIDHAGAPDFAARVAQDVQAKFVFKSRAQSLPADAPSIALDSLPGAVAHRDASSYDAPAFTRQDTLEIIYTSGTTAEPRGVVISHGNVLANLSPIEHGIAEYIRYEKIVHPIRFLNLLPLSHVFGQMLGVFIPPLLTGTVIFLEASPKPADLATTIRRERVSVLVSVPRFMESLQREIERDYENTGRAAQFQKDFASSEGRHFLKRWWRFRRAHRRLGWKFWAFIAGGAALPEQTETFWNRLGYAVIQGYGMPETTSLISLNHPFRSSKGSIGKVFPGMEVRVDDNGEILVRGENVATSYRQHGETKSIAAGDGWFRTGDIAEKDAEGRLFFKGRSKNVIVTPAGMNIYPEDLEKSLRAQPEIRDCVVIGMEQDGNAEPCAVVLLRDANADPAPAIERANQSLAEFQKMRRWFVWPDSDFPRTATQKPILPVIRATVQNATGVSATVGAGSPVSRYSLSGLISRITNRTVAADGATNLDTDLHLTSLDRVELMSALEQRYQAELSDAQFAQVSTVSQLENLIAQGNRQPVQHVYPTWPQNRVTTAIRLLVYYALAWPATYIMAAPRITGRENLRGVEGPVLVIANHVTYLDIAWVLPALPPRLRHRLATAMRGERLAEMRHPAATQNIFERLLEHLRYYLVLSLFNVFPLPQRSGFLESFNFAGNLADRQWNILVFPEGVTTDGVIQEFRGGIGLLAKHLNLPVVPMYLGGLAELKEKHQLFSRPGHVRVAIGKPITIAAEKDPAEITRELERAIRELSQER
jgi:long-chain acyl-CoA synthetase